MSRLPTFQEPRASRRWFSRSALVVELAAILSAYGCLAPAPEADVSGVIEGGGKLIALSAPDAKSINQTFGERDLAAGRLSEELKTRHGLMGFDPAWHDAATLFFEGFEGETDPKDLNWIQNGSPHLQLLQQQEHSTFLRINGDSGENPAGPIKQLYAEPLAGKTLLCQIRTRLSEPGNADRNRIATERRIAPVIRFVILREGGDEQAVYWPIHWHDSVDWDVQRAAWSVPPDILSMSFEVFVPAGGMALDLDDVFICDGRALSLAPARDPERIVPLPVAGDNLLPGGDFEVGQKQFGALHVEVNPDENAERGVASQTFPAPWQFDQPGYLGDYCLSIPLGPLEEGGVREDTGKPRPLRTRIWMGPAWIGRQGSYTVSFAARSSEPLPLVVSVWVRGKRMSIAEGDSGTAWQMYEAAFTLLGPRAAGDAYVVIETGPNHSNLDARLWLDAVSLSVRNAPDEYMPPSRIEMGILGPAEDATDVGHVLHLDQPVEFSLRLVNYDQRAFVGQINLDIVDALDRPVWTASELCSLSKAGTRKNTFETFYRIRLGRGYYQILATAWLGKEGNGTPISRAVRPFAILNLQDTLVAGAPLGLPVAPGRYSSRMTQFGFGWARIALDSADARANPEQWSALVQRCLAQNLELVGEYSVLGNETPPFLGAYSVIPAERLQRLGDFRAHSPGASTSGAPPITGPQNSDGKVIVRHAPERADHASARFLDAQSYLRPGDGGELTLDYDQAPEEIETELQMLDLPGIHRDSLELWDGGIHLGTSSNLLTRPIPTAIAASGGTMVPTLHDPALEASELVRAIAIRLWYGIDRMAIAAYPFQATEPVGAVSYSEALPGGGSSSPISASFCEYDHSPKPVLAAVDFLMEMLNDATGVDWIDGWERTRALVFQAGESDGVVLLWRPAGASIHRFAGLGPLLARAGRGPQSTLRVRNCFGQLEQVPDRSEDLILPVSPHVLFLSAQGPAWNQLLEALPDALAATALAESR